MSAVFNPYTELGYTNQDCVRKHGFTVILSLKSRHVDLDSVPRGRFFNRAIGESLVCVAASKCNHAKRIMALE
jgi:hypothetical protein